MSQISKVTLFHAVDAHRENRVGEAWEAQEGGIPTGLLTRLYLLKPGTPAAGPYPDYSENAVDGTLLGGTSTPTAQSWGMQVAANWAISTGLNWPGSGTAFIAHRSTVPTATGHHNYWIHGSGGVIANTFPTFTTTTPFVSNSEDQHDTHGLATGGSVVSPNRKKIFTEDAAPSLNSVMCFRWNGTTGLAELFSFRGYVSVSNAAGHWGSLSATPLTLGIVGTVSMLGNVYALGVATSLLSYVNCYRIMEGIARYKGASQFLDFNGFVGP